MLLRYQAILLFMFALHQGNSLAQNAPAAQEPVLVTISKETTRITEPLKPSGYPDYLEALNIAARGKVSSQTNGAVLLVRAVGAHDVSPGKQQDEFYKRLGIDPLPENQRRHVFHDDFVQQLKDSELPPPNDEEKKLENDNEQLDARRERVERDFEHCGDHPWTAKEYPLVARWLKEQEQSFAQLDRLREYPDAYMPQLTGEKDGSLVSSKFPFYKIIRGISRDLKIRAMNSLGERNADAAIDDLERLLVLCGYQEKTKNVVGTLIGFAIRGLTHALVNQLVLATPLDSKQLERVQKLIEKHYPENKTPFAESIDQGERLMMLDSICRFAEFGQGRDENKPLPLNQRQHLDYDLMLKLANEHYDRLTSIANLDDSEKQAITFSKVEAELKEITRNAEAISKDFEANPSKEKLSRIIMGILKNLFTPALKLTTQTATRNSMRRELWLLSIALEQHRRKHGQFPKTLDELAPQFLAKVPLDRNTGKPLQYQTDGKGILVYSVGGDLVDHQGFEGDGPKGLKYDDLAIFTNDRRPKPPKLEPLRARKGS